MKKPEENHNLNFPRRVLPPRLSTKSQRVQGQDMEVSLKNQPPFNSSTFFFLWAFENALFIFILWVCTAREFLSLPCTARLQRCDGSRWHGSHSPRLRALSGLSEAIGSNSLGCWASFLSVWPVQPSVGIAASWWNRNCVLESMINAGFSSGMHFWYYIIMLQNQV